MLYLQCPKTPCLKHLFTLAILITSLAGGAQRVLNMEEHDVKPYYFGISLGFNQGSFQSELHPNFLVQDSIATVEPARTVGFNLGLSATARFGGHLELRFNPQLIFAERSINYTLRIADADRSLAIQKKVESVITSFPFQLRFLSDRIGNFKVYMMGGVKYDMDLASNASSRKAEDMIKITRNDYGIEGGIGFKFYNPSFIFSPEIKFSNGLTNLHSRSPALNYSSALGGLRSRMIVFTIHLEG